MKRIFLLCCLLLLFSHYAHAAPIDRGTGMIYDTEFSIAWLQNANYAQTFGYESGGQMSWDESVIYVDKLPPIMFLIGLGLLSLSGVIRKRINTHGK